MNAENPLSISIRVEQKGGTDAGLADLIIGAMGIRGAGRKRRLTADQRTMMTTTLTVAEASAAMSLSPGHVRRLCAGWWSKRRLAHMDHGRWLIYPAADPRLGGCRMTHRRRDLEQVAKLRAEGVNREHLRLAEVRRDIVERFEAFGFGKDVHKSFPQFATSLLADGGPQRAELTKLD